MSRIILFARLELHPLASAINYEKSRQFGGIFHSLFLLLVGHVGPSKWVKFLKLELLVRVLFLVFARVVDMALSSASFVANRYKSYKFVL